MTSNLIGIQREARFKNATPFAFFLENGGFGASLTCTGTSGRALLVGKGQTLLFHNLGASTVFVAWGESDIAATINCLPVFPVVPTLYTLPADENIDTLEYFAGITEGGTCRLLVHRGWGC